MQAAHLLGTTMTTLLRKTQHQRLLAFDRIAGSQLTPLTTTSSQTSTTVIDTVEPPMQQEETLGGVLDTAAALARGNVAGYGAGLSVKACTGLWLCYSELIAQKRVHRQSTRLAGCH